MTEHEPLGLYIHWPYCARICPYCDFNVALDRRPGEARALALAILTDLRAQAGVNRLSLGVQALDDEALRFLGRNHGAGEARRAAAIAARAFPRLSLDLIYARPGQTPPAWTEELKQAVNLGAEHISPYQLTIEPGTPFDRAVARKAFAPADPDLAADLYDTTQDTLSGLGFEAYEVSNHARGPAAQARHNLIYWRGQDYLGVGPGAHGRITAGGARQATVAHARIPAYIAAVTENGTGVAEHEPMDARQRAEERLMMGLRTLEGVALAELEPLRLDRLADLEGFVHVADGRLYATAGGRLVLNRVIAQLAGA